MVDVARGFGWKRGVAVAATAIAVTGMLAGCSPAHKNAVTHTTTRSAHPTPRVSASTVPTDSASPTPAPSSAPTAAPNPAVSHAATPEPAAPAAPVVPPPYSTPVPTGTVVAEGDVSSPKGSIHFHYRFVSNGDTTYSVQYSGFTSTLPVPVGATLFQIAPSVGDGLTSHGTGDGLLGGPTSAPQSSAEPLGKTGKPSYLTSLVTYSAAPVNASGLPTEIQSGKVLAVTPVRWSIPARATNVHPVDGGTRALASGTVTAHAASGAPSRYLIASGDLTSVVAARFGLSIADLIYLNPNLQVFGDQQYLYSGTTLNLDPDVL
ncbi:LysM domain-containing protein [Frondihabitans cladoniiphilus]|uniref:LysM domain-containing protein n=1 Tax=Frondihabitans cladoniiphilus TaxID=715785 RepID=A0ABP8VP53_9MICO